MCHRCHQTRLSILLWEKLVMNLDYSIPVSNNPNPIEEPRALEIIAQPCLTSKLRYRSDFDTNKNRRGVLRSRNNPNYRHPAIRISPTYLDATKQYFIRVSLVTIINDQTNCRYIHPYELEDVNDVERNDRDDNIVIYPIEANDSVGIKSFPNLRIVKTTATELKDHGDLRVFDSPNASATPQLSAAKDTIEGFNLNRLQLAFTVGEAMTVDRIPPYVWFACTTVYSGEITEPAGKQAKPRSRRCHAPSSSSCSTYKYAPQCGSPFDNTEVLIFFTSKLKAERYGDLQITFEHDTSLGHWSEQVLDLEVKDQMVSFRTPVFPFPIDSRTTVNMILKQRRRTFDPLPFTYMTIAPCPRCQLNPTTDPNPARQTNPNKRSISEVYDEESDILNLVEENPPPDPSEILDPEWF